MNRPSTTLDDLKQFRQLDSEVPRAPGGRPGPPESGRRDPARSVRASRPASAWPSLPGGSRPTSTGQGSPDLAPSCKTRLTFDGAGDLQATAPGGRTVHFGIREHAMAAILNGLALSKLRPYGSTFMIFSDYLRNPLRLSALMELPVVYVFTHDSIGVGEDGPTHQPVEQLAMLRAVPGLVVLRPADTAEVIEAWKFIMQRRHGPVALILTRQAVPILDRTRFAAADGLHRGAYVLADAPDGKPDVILLATGSEVAAALRHTGTPSRGCGRPRW